MARGRGLGNNLGTFFRTRESELVALAKPVGNTWSQLYSASALTKPADIGAEEDLTPEASAWIQDVQELGNRVHQRANARVREGKQGELVQRLQDIKDRMFELEDAELQTKTSINMARIMHGSNQSEVSDQVQSLHDIVSELGNLRLSYDRINKQLVRDYSAAYRDIIRTIRPLGDKQSKRDNLSLIPRDWLTRSAEQGEGSYQVMRQLAENSENLSMVGWVYSRWCDQEVARSGFMTDPYCRRYSQKPEGRLPESEILALAAEAIAGKDQRLWSIWHDDTPYRDYYLGCLASV
jgi:hypothetical protein